VSARFDFPNFIGLLFILAAIALWSQAAFAFLDVQLKNFLIYTVLGFVMSILGGYLLKPHSSR
jgi:predicted transporter